MFLITRKIVKPLWVLCAIIAGLLCCTNRAQAQIAHCDTFAVTQIGDTLRVNTDPVTMRVRADIAQTRDAVCIHATTEGYYRIWAGIDYSDGQSNESFYLRVRYPDASFATMCDPNAGPYKVVQDTTTLPLQITRDGGQFYFQEGDNIIILNHYALIDDEYPQYLNPPGVPMAPGPESVHVYKFVFEFLEECRLPYDLQITKQSSADTVRVGTSFQYELTINNLGPHKARNFTVSDSLPGLISAIGFNPPPDTIQDNTFYWFFDSLEVQSDTVISFTARADSLPGTEPLSLVNSCWVSAELDTDLENNYDEHTVVVLLPPPPPNYDLAVLKQSSLDTARTGDTYQYSIHLHNNGPDTAFDISLSDSLPNYISVSNFNVAPDIAQPNHLYWFLDSLIPGEDFTLTFFAKVDSQLPLSPYSLVNEASVSALYDTKTTNNHSRATVVAISPTAPQNYDLALSKSADKDTVRVTAEFVYQLTVQNLGGYTAYDIALNDTLPNFVTPINYTMQPDSVVSGIIYWSLDSLEAQKVTQLIYTVKVVEIPPETPHDLINSAVVRAPHDIYDENNYAHTTVVAVPGGAPGSQNYDLTLTKSTSQDTVYVGGDFIYTLKVKNFGPTTARDIKLIDSVPPYITPSQFSQDPDSVYMSILFWFFDSLRIDEEETISFTAGVSASLPHVPYSFVNTSAVAAPNDTNATNDFAHATVVAIEAPPPPLYDLAVTKIASKDSVLAGASVSYQIIVDNLSPVHAEQVVLGDVLPGFVTPIQFSRQPDSLYQNGIFWFFDRIAPGGREIIDFTVKVDRQFPFLPYPLFNSATVSAPRDTNAFNNHDEVLVYAVEPPPQEYDLTLSKVADADSVIAGGSFSYRLVLQNLGPFTAYDITLTDTLPASVTPHNFSLPPTSASTTTLIWNFDSLATSQSIIISFSVYVDSLLPISPYRLYNRSKIDAPNDINTANNRATAIVWAKGPLLPREFDLSLGKLATKDTVYVGEIFLYQLTVENLGPDQAINFNLTDIIPDYLTAYNFSHTPYSIHQDTILWHIDSLGVAKKKTIAFLAQVDTLVPPAPMRLVNYGVVSSKDDPNTSNNTATATVHAIEPPPNTTDVQLTKSANKDTVYAGGDFFYQISALNLGPHPAQQLVVTDTLPDYTTAHTFSVAPDSAHDNMLFWFFDSLEVGQEKTIIFSVTAATALPYSPMMLINAAGVETPYDTNSRNNWARASVIARFPGQPENYDIGVQKYATRDSVLVGEEYHYHLRVTNHGPRTAHDIFLFDALPPYVTASNFSVTPDSIVGKNLFWHFNSLPPAEEIFVSFSAWIDYSLPGSPYTLVNNCTVSAPLDTNTTNNVARATVFGLLPPASNNYDLSVSKTASDDFVFSGDTLEYTLSVENLGPNTVLNYTLRDTLPDVVSALAYSRDPNYIEDNVYTWHLDVLTPGTSHNITLTVAVDDPLPQSPMELINTALIFAPSDTNAANNLDRVAVTARKKPDRYDIELLKNSSVDSVLTGETFAYALILKNYGPSTAKNIVVQDTLPAFISTSNHSLSHSLSGNVLTWFIDSLTVEQQITISFDAVVDDGLTPSPLRLVNIASATAALDTDPSNNTDSATLLAMRPVPPPPNYDLSITKTANKDTVFCSEEVSYQITVENHGPGTAYDVVLADSLPNYMAPFQYSSNPDSSYLSIVFWRFDSLMSSQRVTFTYTARAADALPHSPMAIVNTLLVDAAQDTNSSNDRTTAKVVALEYQEDCEKSYYFDQNVFRPDTGVPLGIFFALAEPSNVRLELYDITGYNITTLHEDFYTAGMHSYYWNGNTGEGQKIGSGVYIITYRTETLLCWKKVIVVR